MKLCNLASVHIYCVPGLMGPQSIIDSLSFKGFYPSASTKFLKPYHSFHDPNSSFPFPHPYSTSHFLQLQTTQRGHLILIHSNLGGLVIPWRLILPTVVSNTLLVFSGGLALSVAYSVWNHDPFFFTRFFSSSLKHSGQHILSI